MKNDQLIILLKEDKTGKLSQSIWYYNYYTTST